MAAAPPPAARRLGQGTRVVNGGGPVFDRLRPAYLQAILTSSGSVPVEHLDERGQCLVGRGLKLKDIRAPVAEVWPDAAVTTSGCTGYAVVLAAGTT